MSYDDFDDPIRKLLEKAERIANEELEIEQNYRHEQKKIDESIRKKKEIHNQDVEKLTEVREQLGRLRIARVQKIKEIKEIEKNISKAKTIRSKYTDYFEAIENLTGDELIKARQRIIGDNWSEYSKMLDRYRELVGSQDMQALTTKIQELKEDIQLITMEIAKLDPIQQILIDKITQFLKENPG